MTFVFRLVGALLIAAGSGSYAAADSMSLSGSLGASYSYLKTPGGDTSVWDGLGEVNFTITDPGFNVELRGANDYSNFLQTNGVRHDLWDYGGDAYFRDYAGAIGASVTAVQLPVQHSSQSIAYGGFGEAYLFGAFTLRAKGGAISNDLSGYYAAGGAAAYPVKNIAVNLEFDYAKLEHNGPDLKSVGLTAEYLPVPSVPVSLTFGYSYETVSQISNHVDVWSAGIKVYLGGAGRDGSLRDRQRDGALVWNGAPQNLLGLTL